MEDLHTRMCKKIADLTRVIDRLFRQYYEQNILFLTLKNDRERHQHSIDQEQAQLKEQEMKRLRETVQQLEGELSRINTCKLSMKKEMLHLETTLEANSILLQKTSTENSSIKQEINSLRQKLEDEQECQACTERAHQLVEVEIKIVNQLNELKRLNVCNNTLEQEKVSLDRELGVRQRKAEWLECELASVQSLLDQYQSENKELKSTISCLEEKLLKSTKPSCKPSPVDPFLIKQKRERQYWLETAPKVSSIVILFIT